MACNLYFTEYREMSDQQIISMLIQCFTARAMDWAATVWKAGSLPTSSYTEFVRQIWIVFNHPEHGLTSEQQLLNLCQGETSAAQYAISFRVLAAESRWNQSVFERAAF